MKWQLRIFGTISAFAFRHRETKKRHKESRNISVIYGKCKILI